LSREVIKIGDKKIPICPDTLEKLVKIIESVQYGSVTMLIQDGKVTQIERNEKIRLR